MCCISSSNSACRSSCDRYVWEQVARFALFTCGGVATFAIFLYVCYCCTRYCGRKGQDWVRSISHMQTVRVVERGGGRQIPAIPYKEYYAFIATAQDYGLAATGYAPLRNPNCDGESIESCLLSRGYDRNHVLRVPGATKTRFRSSLTQLVQSMQGKDRVLVLVYMSGHGSEVLGNLAWAGEDVVKGDHDTYVFLPEIITRAIDP